jgi:hypothetical protein
VYWREKATKELARAIELMCFILRSIGITVAGGWLAGGSAGNLPADASLL